MRWRLPLKRNFSTCLQNARSVQCPPFGNLYGMEVFVDETLTEDKEIAFNAGTHADLIGMAYNNFEWLVNPKVVKVARY